MTTDDDLEQLRAALEALQREADATDMMMVRLLGKRMTNQAKSGDQLRDELHLSRRNKP